MIFKCKRKKKDLIKYQTNTKKNKKIKSFELTIILTRTKYFPSKSNTLNNKKN